MSEYHYTECGLDNIYLINGFEITKYDGDDEIFIHDVHGLHQAIGMSIVFKQGPLIGNEIKFIRTTLDLSQTRLAQLLGCGYQTVLLWEKNKTPISPTADRLLRIMFFEYLTPERDRKIFDLINDIADFDAETISTKKKIIFEETPKEWRIVA